MKHTYLVTGGAGFIGSHVAQSLALRGDNVVVIDDFNSGLYPSELKRDRVKALLEPHGVQIHECDIRDRDKTESIFQRYRIAKICHLAAWAGVAPSLKWPEIYESVNITGTRHVFDLAVKYRVDKVVYASSSSVYGANSKMPFAERDKTDRPVGPYAMTKKANELQAHFYHQVYGLKSIGLRFFTVYGPWGRPDMALFVFIKKILNNEPIKVNNYGRMKRNFTYVDDIASGVIASLDRPVGYAIFNLGADDTVALEDFIAVIENTLGLKARKEYQPMPPGEVPDTIANVTKAKRLLGYEPKIKVAEGIPRFWQWYKSYHGL